MGEFYNKEYYNQIKGNCAYIDLSANSIQTVMRALYDAGIRFSAVFGGYRNTITVHNDDKQRALEIANANRGVNKANQRVIGNTDYKSIQDKHYINTSTDLAMQVSAILSGDNSIKFSGIIKGTVTTLTVSGAKNAETVNRMIDNIRNADILEELARAGFDRLPDSDGFIIIRNIETGETAGFRNMGMVRNMFNDMNNEFFHAPVYIVESASENAEPFYISETDGTSERNIYIDSAGESPVFETYEKAEEYAASNNIPIGNTAVPTENVEEIQQNVDPQADEKTAVVEACYDRLKGAVFDNEAVRNALENSDFPNADIEARTQMKNIALSIFNEDIHGNVEFYSDFFLNEKSERRIALEEYVTETIRSTIYERDNAVTPLDEVIQKAESDNVPVEHIDISVPETIPAEDKALRNEMLLHEVMHGSGFANGKQRISDFYNAHNAEPKFNKAFADFLKNEYGIGGHSGDDVILMQNHDSKGISLEYMENDVRRKTNYSWNDVGKAISKLISDGKYITEQAAAENTRDNSAVSQETAEVIDKSEEYIRKALDEHRTIYFNSVTGKISSRGKNILDNAGNPYIEYSGETGAFVLRADVAGIARSYMRPVANADAAIEIIHKSKLEIKGYGEIPAPFVRHEEMSAETLDRVLTAVSLIDNGDTTLKERIIAAYDENKDKDIIDCYYKNGYDVLFISGD